MSTHIAKIKVAFDPLDGHFLEWTSPKSEFIEDYKSRDPVTHLCPQIPIKWLNNYSFKADFKILPSIYAKHHLQLKDISNNKRFTIVAEDFITALKTRNVINGVISGEWTFQRKGGICTIIPYEP